MAVQICIYHLNTYQTGKKFRFSDVLSIWTSGVLTLRVWYRGYQVKNHTILAQYWHQIIGILIVRSLGANCSAIFRPKNLSEDVSIIPVAFKYCTILSDILIIPWSKHRTFKSPIFWRFR